MTQRNDQIFQLSLTEIAFIIIFLLLLLLGYLVFKEQNEKELAQAELARVQTSERAMDALSAAKSALSNQLKSADIRNPDEVISKLIAANELQSERDQLKKQVEDLDAKLTALTELKEQLAEAATSDRSNVIQEKIVSALALQDSVLDIIKNNQVKKNNSKEVQDKEAIETVRQALITTEEFKKQLKEKLDKPLSPGKESQIIGEIVTAAKSYGELAKSGRSTETILTENSDLRGQIAFLKNRLNARGGRDYPPCWVDENGKIEFLFALEVRSDSIIVTPAWPARREEAANKLPSIDSILIGPHPHQAFVSSIQGIFNWSKAQDPECRHFVQMKNTISDAVQSDRARLMIEKFFYKLEAPR